MGWQGASSALACLLGLDIEWGGGGPYIIGTSARGGAGPPVHMVCQTPGGKPRLLHTVVSGVPAAGGGKPQCPRASQASASSNCQRPRVPKQVTWPSAESKSAGEGPTGLMGGVAKCVFLCFNRQFRFTGN